MKQVVQLFPLLLVIASGSAFSQLRTPERVLPQVADPSMVVIDRGAKLEVFPTERSMPQNDTSGRGTAQRVVASSANAVIGPAQLGVVFNHAMQQRGFISGEITFQMKSGLKMPSLSSALYPGLKRITNPEVYVVNARTPAEFIAVLKRLQARNDLAWVEPTVIYSASQGTTVNQSAQ